MLVLCVPFVDVANAGGRQRQQRDLLQRLKPRLSYFEYDEAFFE